ncbi:MULTISPECIES: hypothetical protein [Bacillaceae]|uniref:Uncharacterized protein n=1 Tax=Domibacillus aminovorans TaxID=29332 RepID=A0A177KYL9_9BACI|nr:MULTISPECIES: hypothetical protein [Bacillaceae]OAH58450.1 hypothetical protein AWH48_17870 [Domibacillus aminovorans]
MTLKLVKIVRTNPVYNKWYEQNLNETFHVMDDGRERYIVIWPAFERRNRRSIPKSLCEVVEGEENDVLNNPVARDYLGEWAQPLEGEKW